MIRATDLSGRAVVDMDAAEKLGRIHSVIIDPDARHVAGFRLTRGGSLLGNEAHATVPATSVYAIGPDVITVRHATDLGGEDAARLDRLPRVSDLIGRKVVSREGRLLGVVNDVLISGADGRVVGYLLADLDVMSRLESLFVNRKHRRGSYIRADADLRAGRELIVVPEDSVSNWDEDLPKTAPAHP
jgi:sporulation protein YlmC with PRC-barrel domain